MGERRMLSPAELLPFIIEQVHTKTHHLSFHTMKRKLDYWNYMFFPREQLLQDVSLTEYLPTVSIVSWGKLTWSGSSFGGLSTKNRYCQEKFSRLMLLSWILNLSGTRPTDTCITLSMFAVAMRGLHWCQTYRQQTSPPGSRNSFL